MKGIQLTLLMTCIAGLTACESPRLDIYPAKVMTMGEKVCVLIAARENEYLNGLQIVEAGKEKEAFRKYFDHVTTKNPVKLYPDRCVPDFGYEWQTGKAYSFLIETYSQDGKATRGRNFVASFTLYRAGGELSATSL
jgi:hypothetical protein